MYLSPNYNGTRGRGKIYFYGTDSIEGNYKIGIKDNLYDSETNFPINYAETFNNEPVLTAFALREENNHSLKRTEINYLELTGNWALISQDNRSVPGGGRSGQGKGVAWVYD